MENTIRVQDHPSIAVGKRNVILQEIHSQHQEYLDYMNDITPFVGNVSFDDVDDDLPF